MSWMGLPSRRSHRVMTSSERDNRKGSKAAMIEPEMFHLLPAWWLLSCSKLIVVKPEKSNSTGLYCGNTGRKSKNYCQRFCICWEIRSDIPSNITRFKVLNFWSQHYNKLFILRSNSKHSLLLITTE